MPPTRDRPVEGVAGAARFIACPEIACYQQSTNDALLAVMSEERKVRDVAVVGRMREETGNETGNVREMHRAPRIATDGGALSYRIAPPGLEPGLS